MIPAVLLHFTTMCDALDIFHYQLAASLAISFVAERMKFLVMICILPDEGKAEKANCSFLLI